MPDPILKRMGFGLPALLKPAPAPAVSTTALAGSVQLGGSEPSDFKPNEPVGFAQIANHHQFNALEPPSEPEWTIVSAPASSIEQDATAPYSPPNVLRTFFPQGLTGGGGGQNQFSRAIRFAGSFTELYWAFHIKFSSNFQGHQSSINKLNYVQMGDSTPVYVLEVHCNGAGPINAHCVVQGAGPSFALNSNGAKQYTRGQWHRSEVLMRINDLGVNNAELHWWIDDTKVMNHVGGFQVLLSGQSPWNFRKFNIDPVWGGLADTVNADMWFDYDHMYISGKA